MGSELIYNGIHRRKGSLPIGTAAPYRGEQKVSGGSRLRSSVGQSGSFLNCVPLVRVQPGTPHAGMIV